MWHLSGRAPNTILGPPWFFWLLSRKQNCPVGDAFVQEGLCHSNSIFFKKKTQKLCPSNWHFMTDFPKLQEHSLSLVPPDVGGSSWRWASARWWLWPSLGHGPARLPGLRRSQSSGKSSPAPIPSPSHGCVCFFPCRWAPAVAGSCGLQPEPSRALPWLSSRSSKPRCPPGLFLPLHVGPTSSQQELSACLHHKILFKVWLRAARSQRAAGKSTSPRGFLGFF